MELVAEEEAMMRQVRFHRTVQAAGAMLERVVQAAIRCTAGGSAQQFTDSLYGLTDEQALEALRRRLQAQSNIVPFPAALETLQRFRNRRLPKQLASVPQASDPSMNDVIAQYWGSGGAGRRENLLLALEETYRLPPLTLAMSAPRLLMRAPLSDSLVALGDHVLPLAAMAHALPISGTLSDIHGRMNEARPIRLYCSPDVAEGQAGSDLAKEFPKWLTSNRHDAHDL